MSVPEDRSFFVLSCARSGSTSLAEILDAASNGACLVEPAPDLNVEARHAMDGRSVEKRSVLEQKVLPRVVANLEHHAVYGEKHVTYGPFIRELRDLFGCRFVFLERDGRDVVRSLMDWHERMFGDIYRECKDPGQLDGRAISAAANLPVHEDTSDYARPRPLPGEPLYARWDSLSREEMCAYYWTRINELHLRELEQIPSDAWIEIDYTGVDAERVIEVASFLGLEGLDRGRVEEQLARRINSLADRIGNRDRYPDWRNWDSGLRDRFADIAGPLMRRLGYFEDARSDWRPNGYGRFWLEHDGGLDWYEWMYGTRRRMHEDLVAWVRARSGEISTIADLGCGVGVGYCDDFADLRYVGVDLAAQNIEWCGANRKNPAHEYRCVDFIAEPLEETFDLAFSSGTIDNSYDADEYLRALVRASRGWIQATCYRGWFPELREHRYAYDPEHACFYNDLSPSRIRRTLEAEGCTDIRVEPVATGRTDIPYETWISARVAPRGGEGTANLRALE